MAEAKEKPQYYSWSLLKLYDWYVLGFNMACVWGCPAKSVQFPFFYDNLSKNHLDIGVATGWFPATALQQKPPFQLKQDTQHITLMDREVTSLQHSKARILQQAPGADVKCVYGDVLEALPKELKGAKFDSISMFNLLHCVPEGKFVAFSTCKDVLADDGVLVGCTILGEAHATGWFTRWYLRWYRNVGWFKNWGDKAEDVQKALHENFEEVGTWMVGMILVFKARKPKRI